MTSSQKRVMVYVVKRRDVVGRESYLKSVMPLEWSVGVLDAVRMRSEIAANVIAGLTGGRVVKMVRVKR